MEQPPTFSAGDVVRAIDIAPHLLARWLDRGTITMRGPDRPSTSSGRPRGFSPRRIVQVAIIHALTRLGVAPSIAATAAAKFTDEPARGRGACELFPDGATWLVMTPDGGSRVVNVPDHASAADVLSSAKPDSEGAVVTVDLNKITNNVFARLKAIQ